jgi:hypothetical protein
LTSLGDMGRSEREKKRPRLRVKGGVALGR